MTTLHVTQAPLAWPDVPKDEQTAAEGSSNSTTGNNDGGKAYRKEQEEGNQRQ